MNYEAYTRLTDEELLSEIGAGHTYAMDTLINRYKNLVRKNAKTMYLIGGEHDDLLQEGMIGLYKAIRDYQREKNSSFYHFADLCISRQIYTAIKSSNTMKNQPLNNYISFDAADGSDVNGTESLPPLELYLPHTGNNPEELIIHKENQKQMEELLAKTLSSFEMQVLKAYLAEENYTRVAEKLGKKPKMVDNALQRVRKKLAGLKLFDELVDL